jgi:glycosyltransferase involved in cell wall biosynthesis
MFAISFVIPCYNAETFILKNITQLKKKINRLKLTYEIILIDDGSQDNTNAILSEIKKKYRFVNLIKNKKNTGKSYSLLKGIKKSKYQNIIMIDCDLPYFKSLDKIVHFLKKNIDLVIINRKLKDSKLATKKLNLYQLVRFCLGAIIALINRKVLKLNIEGGDTQAGLKGFKKNNYFKKNKFISTKFFFDLELIHLYSKKKLKIVSVKTVFNVPKKSSIKIFNLIKNYYILKELVKILFFYSRLN